MASMTPGHVAPDLVGRGLPLYSSLGFGRNVERIFRRLPPPPGIVRSIHEDEDCERRSGARLRGL